ncbi:MAG: PA4780 family RIO1-like protein kinase [Myxococcota bacterium]
MKIPKRIQPLIDEGLVDEVVRPITSGKEAEVFIVWSQGALRAAKVYKEVNQRSFKNRADYLDGRAVRGSRGERARQKGGKFGKEQEESAWQTAELSALGRLAAAGVRVPTPRAYLDGVLIMDLVLTAAGTPAPRLADCGFTMGEARDLFDAVIHEVQRMLCAGVVHGDLSEYNVLLSAYGPVIIDLPQMVDAAASGVARRLLIRDVGNIRAFVGRFAPDVLRSRFAEEMWSLWERAMLTPDTRLTGQWRESTRRVDTESVLSSIADAEHERARAGAPRRTGRRRAGRSREQQPGGAPRTSGGPRPRGPRRR